MATKRKGSPLKRTSRPPIRLHQPADQGQGGIYTLEVFLRSGRLSCAEAGRPIFFALGGIREEILAVPVVNGLDEIFVVRLGNGLDPNSLCVLGNGLDANFLLAVPNFLDGILAMKSRWFD
jgi:hypothetical protein